MTVVKTLAALSAGLALVVPVWLSAQDVVDLRLTEAEAVDMLRSDDLDDVFTAAFWVTHDLSAAAEAGPELRQALVQGLEEALRRKQQRMRRREPFGSEAPAETRVQLVEAVAALHDPGTIPVLARAVVPNAGDAALADFGELAVNEVLQVVLEDSPPHGDYMNVEGSLIVLRYMVEGRSLGPASLERVRTAALERLAGEQPFVVLKYAVDLAFVLGELGIVGEFAAYPPAYAVADDDPDRILANYIQQHAASLLAGTKVPKPQRSPR